MFQYPCKDCTDRAVGCHSTCQKYLEAKAVHTHKVQEILAVKKVEDGLDSYKVKVIRKNKKRFEKRR